MTSLLLDSTHGRKTSGVACHHRLWAGHMVGLRPAWQNIIALGQHTRSNDVGRGMPASPLDSTHTVERRWAWNNITAFGQHTRSKNVGRDMPSPLFDSTFRRTSSGVACHHRRWAAHMVKRCQVCHDITTLGLHARSDDVEHGMTSPPLDSTHGRTTSGVA